MYICVALYVYTSRHYINYVHAHVREEGKEGKKGWGRGEKGEGKWQKWGCEEVFCRFLGVFGEF